MLNYYAINSSSNIFNFSNFILISLQYYLNKERAEDVKLLRY